MSFSTLQSLLTLNEGDDAVLSNYGPKDHPSLSRAELVRFNDKISQAQAKLEEIESVFKHAPGATGPAHKLHHIGVKAGSDMAVLDAVQRKIHELADAIDELHQAWGSGMMQDTGAFDDTDEGNEAPTDEEEPVGDEDQVK